MSSFEETFGKDNCVPIHRNTLKSIAKETSMVKIKFTFTKNI